MEEVKKESFLKKFNRLNIAIEENISKDLSLFKKLLLMFDFIIEYKFYGVQILDYIQYDFYSKKKNERRKYIVHGKLLEIMKICNNPEIRYIFDQKPEFDKNFSDLLQRDWIDTKLSDINEFKKFIKNKEHFFAKQPDGMFGTGVKKIYTKDIENVENTFSSFQTNHILCEGTLTQCKEMAEFNTTSLNTLRVVTIVKTNGEVEIMGGLLRVGRKGRVADNFHHMGIASFIEPNTGIVTTLGIDKNKNRHIVHPDSGKQIIGFHIPYWEKVIKTVSEAALRFPEMRYIGWDVAITEDYNIALIEGNPGADPDAEQITTKEGRWLYYEKFLKEMTKK